MKKLISALLIIGMIACLSAPALAEFMPSDGTNTSHDISDLPFDVTVPVYGYVGPDATIVDNTDPPGPPTVILGVSVPVNLLWAAFKSDAGAVTSPNYYIQNNSATPVNMKITSFTADTSTPALVTAAGAVNKDLTLKLVGINGATPVSVWTSNGTTGTGIASGSPVDLGNLGALGSSTEKRTFTIGGAFPAASIPDNTDYRPQYKMVLTFDVAS